VFIDLPCQISSFEVLEREIIELENFEISFNIPWISILLQFSLCNFTIEISDNFINQSWYVQCEKIDNFIEYCCSSIIWDTHKP